MIKLNSSCRYTHKSNGYTSGMSVVIFTEDSPHHGEGEFREIEVPFAKIIKAEVFV